MSIWSAEIKELEKLYESFKGQFPVLEKELEQLIKTTDANVVMLYSRRCLEVIVTDLCECELKRPRKTEPLKGIIDKLHKEEKVPSHILTSMTGLNELSTYGAHPKDFDPEQVKPVLINLDIIIKWYLKYKDTQNISKSKTAEKAVESKHPEFLEKVIRKPQKKLILFLSGLLLAVIVIVVLLTFNIIGTGKQAKGLAGLEKSIAVLPFINDSPDANEENTAFINGLMDEILINLQTIKVLRVISRTSVEQFRGLQKPTIPEIAKKLGVNYIVEGSAQKYGNKIRLRVQLIRADKESHLWAKSYDEEINNINDIFSIQSQIAEAIAIELEAEITPQEKQLIEKIPTLNLAAYEAYLQGTFYWKKSTQDGWDIALQYFEKAKEIDPDYALAYTGICSVWYQRQQFGLIPPEEATPKAMAAIRKALDLDSTSAEVHYTLGMINMNIMWDWKGSESEFRKAISLNPNFADAHASYSNFLIIVGQSGKSLEQSKLALKLDPNNINSMVLYGITLLFTHNYDDAINAFQGVLINEPTNVLALGNLPITLHMVGRYDEAMVFWKSYFHNCFKNFVHYFGPGNTKVNYIEALSLEADTLVAQSKTTYINPTEIAVLYACVGNKERALDMLESAYKVHDPNMPYLQYPVYDFLRNEPRFQDLCRKMNLPYKLIE